MNSVVSLRVRVSLTVLLGAFLLFSFQPMLGKMVLPVLGGAASVWTVAVLFFQVMLLAGYVYADRISQLRSFRLQILVHLSLMSLGLLFLPVRLNAETSPTVENPVLWELLTLLRTSALPYLMVSTTAPLLQNWFSRTTDPNAHDPYFLYAVSNAGSLLALLAYPFFVEPVFGVRNQALLWLWGYAFLMLFVIGLAFAFPGQGREPSEAERLETLSWKTRVYWLLAALVPSGLMLGVTTHISVNLAAMPLVWTIPLATYLLTFILAFSRRIRVTPAQIGRVALPALILLCPVVGLRVPVVLSVDIFMIAIHIVLLFIAGLLCHTALAASRPSVRYLTRYYVWIAVGGALGGIFAAVLAPLIFTSVFEYPLLLSASVLFWRPPGGRWRWASVAVAGLILIYAVALPPYLARPGKTIYATRNFYGVKRVVDFDQSAREVLNGDTMHGIEDRRNAGQPLAYYHPEGPFGEVIDAFGTDRPRRIGVLGLGAGTIAAYANPTRRVTFFEIDPAVEKIAASFFSFLERCGAWCDVVSGDGRLSIARSEDASFDLVVLDAFSSDSIPAHLLSREAVALYLSKLKPDGALLFHVSNRYLRIRDLAAALSRDAGLEARVRVDALDDRPYKARSIYVIASRSIDSLGSLSTDRDWQPVVVPAGLRVWTDDYSSLIELLQWEPEWP